MANDPFKYEVRNPEIEKILKDIGYMIGDSLPKGYGMTLMIFGYLPSHELFYISSASRADMISTMREFIEKFGEN